MSQEAEFEPGHSKGSTPFLPESIYTSRSGAPCATLTAVPQAEAALVYFCAGESVLECLPQACSDQAHNTQPSSVPQGPRAGGTRVPLSCSLTRGDRTRHKAPRAPLLAGVEWRTSPRGLSGLHVPDCPVPGARGAAVRKRGRRTHTCSQHTVSYLAFGMLSPAPGRGFARILFQQNGTFTATLFPAP